MISAARSFAWRPARWTWAWVLCLALALRALVPDGYMPDPGARAQGVLALTICTAHDPAGLNAPIIPAHGPGSAHDCPLCLFAHHASGSPLPAGTTPALFATPAAAIAGIADTLVAHVFRERGAPLGPRAPPRPER